MVSGKLKEGLRFVVGSESVRARCSYKYAEQAALSREVKAALNSL